ncbi:TonB-dependent receptor, partial [Aliarcobacter vitoriensis]
RKDAENVSFEMPTSEKTKLNSQALNISYETEKVKFDSTTTHKKTNFIGDYDTDYKANNNDDGLRQYNYADIDTWTQELKLSSKNQDIKWVTGLYFDKEERDQGPYGEDRFYNLNDGTGTYVPGIYHSNSDSLTNSKTYAIFGQTMIPLGESFELTLGGRYQKIKKDISADVRQTFTNTLHYQLPNFNYSNEKTWNSFLPKAALSYKINDNLTTYASISKGYMPGGFNFFPSSTSDADNTFEAQKSINYEIGAKYIGDNFAINTAIFRMDIKDIHIYKIDPITNNYATDNAKKAHSQGIEIDGTYFLTDNWSVSGAVGLVQAKYDDYDGGVRKYDGEKVENTPNYTASLGISYLADSGLYGRVDLSARGTTYYYDAVKHEMLKDDGGIISNAKIGYKLKDWDIYSYITNITDEGYVAGYSAKEGFVVAGFNEPRRFGIGAIYKF